MSTKIFYLVIASIAAYCIVSFLHGQATQMGAHLTACIDQIGQAAPCQTTSTRTGAWTPEPSAPAKMLTLAK